MNYLLAGVACSAGIGLLQHYIIRRYWKGRLDGWKACEMMVMDRAKKEGYKTDVIWEDLLQ